MPNNQTDPNTGAPIQPVATVPVTTTTFSEETVGNPSMTPTPDPVTPVVANIAERLAETTVVETKEDAAKPTANTPIMVDLANLSPESLSMLKSMLQVTPDRVQAPRGNIRIQIRSVEVDDTTRYIMDFKRAKMSLGYHAETGKEMEMLVIPVLLNGATDFIEMEYSEFMSSPRVTVEVIDQRSKKNVIEEGQVIQRETGKLVNKEITTVEYWYTVKLPNGETVELQGKMANA
jgi:hypothetical protein